MRAAALTRILGEERLATSATRRHYAQTTPGPGGEYCIKTPIRSSNQAVRGPRPAGSEWRAMVRQMETGRGLSRQIYPQRQMQRSRESLACLLAAVATGRRHRLLQLLLLLLLQGMIKGSSPLGALGTATMASHMQTLPSLASGPHAARSCARHQQQMTCKHWIRCRAGRERPACPALARTEAPHRHRRHCDAKQQSPGVSSLAKRRLTLRIVVAGTSPLASMDPIHGSAPSSAGAPRTGLRPRLLESCGAMPFNPI